MRRLRHGKRKDAVDGEVNPFAHFCGRDWLAGITAFPADDIEGGIVGCANALVGAIPNGLPLRERSVGIGFGTGDNIGNQPLISGDIFANDDAGSGD